MNICNFWQGVFHKFSHAYFNLLLTHLDRCARFFGFYFACIICEKLFDRCKLIHEKIPSTDPGEIEKYTETLNRDMGFTGKNIIEPSDLDPNPMKKEHIKGMMNQGKWLM